MYTVLYCVGCCCDMCYVCGVCACVGGRLRRGSRKRPQPALCLCLCLSALIYCTAEYSCVSYNFQISRPKQNAQKYYYLRRAMAFRASAGRPKALMTALGAITKHLTLEPLWKMPRVFDLDPLLCASLILIIVQQTQLRRAPTQRVGEGAEGGVGVPSSANSHVGWAKHQL
jgi:hypothetical protein